MLVVIDPGHGGNDPGAVYNGRKEKDDTLNLALAVGNILEENGINVVYTRTSDVYETPFTKATKGNEAGADFFISIHRNSSEKPNEYNGTSTLIFDNAGIKKEMAANINAELKKVGYNDLGTDIRPNLVVLKRTKMPAILVEAGFINSDKDNALFDEEFYDTADAIAKGILKTLRKQEEYVKNTSTEQKIEAYKENTDNINNDNNMECICDREAIYRVQTGAFENQANADTMLNRLLMEDIPAFIIYENGLYKVQVGAYKKLDNAVKMERRLRRMGYNTYISKLMILANAYEEAKSITKDDYRLLLILLNPVAPHITEELNQEMGYDILVTAKWPVCDESKLVEDEREIAVQVNGKVRGTINIRMDEDEETIKNRALALENVKKHLEGLEVIKIMVIKNKIVTIVAK